MVKQIKYKFWPVCWFTVIALTVTGCANHEQRQNHGIQSPEWTKELVVHLANFYPASFNALHHVSLNIRGKTIILNGYLKVNRPAGAVHLIAQGEMGGTLFEVQIQKGQPDIIKTAKFFKPQWLEQSVARDLRHLYLKPDFDTPLTFNRNLNLILCEVNERETRNYIFSRKKRGGLKLSEFSIEQSNLPVYCIEYSYAAGSSLPTFIKLEDKTLDYTLNINVRYMITGKE